MEKKDLKNYFFKKTLQIIMRSLYKSGLNYGNCIKKEKAIENERQKNCKKN